MPFKLLCKKIAFVLTFTATSYASAETYYISPAGNDNAIGTSINEAWQSINKLNSIQLQPGTTILFEGGQQFNGSIYIDPTDANNPAQPVVLSSYGTGRATIYSGLSYGLYVYNTQGIVVSNIAFTGSGMASNTSTGVLFYTDLTGDIKLNTIRLEQLEIYGYGANGISISSGSGNSGFKNVVIDSVHVHDVKTNGIITSGFSTQTHIGWAHETITIRNTEVNNIPGYSDPNGHKGSGIMLGQVNGGVIEKCVAHHTGYNNTHCGGPGGIWVWDCNNIIIQYCESYLNRSGTGCDGLGFDLDGGVSNSILQYNYSHDNDGAGYLLGQYDDARPWSNNIMRFNISENDGRTNGGGITLFKGNNTIMSGAKIYNNTVYISPSATNPNAGALTVIDWHKGITGTEIYNNILQTTGNVNLISFPVGYSAFFAGNLYWSSGDDFKLVYQGTTYTNLADWRSATGNEQTALGATGVVADPLFNYSGTGYIVYPASPNNLNAYQLAANSPAVDAGVDIGSLYSLARGTHDFFNNTIYDGAIADIGAHEVTLSTGIASTATENIITIYPNPVKSGNPIIIKTQQLPYSAELISVTGAKVWQDFKIESQEFLVPTNNLAAGVYILSIKDKNSILRQNKMVVN